MPVKILVCGDRDWTDVKAIERVLADLYVEGAVLHHGDNGYDREGKPLWGKADDLAVKGADKLAGAVARRLGYTVIVHTPDWGKFKRAAGPIRNREQAKERCDVIVAFHDDVRKSRGTKDMLKAALAEGAKAFIVCRSESVAHKLGPQEVSRLLMQ